MSYMSVNDWSLPIEEEEDPEAWKRGYMKQDWNKRARALSNILRGAALKIVLAKKYGQVRETQFYANAAKKVIAKLQKKLIEAEEAKAFSILEDEILEWFKMIGFEFKIEGHYNEYMNQKLLEEPKALVKTEVFGLGLTTYKSGEVKDYQSESWRITQQITKELIPKLKGVTVVQTIPTIGYWKGSKEPSTMLILRGNLSEFNLHQINAFKEKYHQEAIMVFNPETDIDKVLTGIKEKDLPTLNLEALTYDFERGKVFVVGKGARFI
jgi:hypothetical protein